MSDTRFFVESTPQYRADSKAYSCTNVYERFKKDVEGHQHRPGTNRNVYFKNYYKKQHENFRSIFYIHEFSVGSQKVVCYLALRVLKRGETDYERFINDTAESAEERRRVITGLNAVDFKKLEMNLTEALQKPMEQVEDQPLDDGERTFIEPSAGITIKIFKDGIYESKEWIEAVNSKDSIKFHKIADAFKKFFELNLEQEVKNGFHEIEYGFDKEKILCAKLVKDRNDWSWFLLALGDDEAIRKSREKYEKDPDCMSHDDLASKCLRAYPYSMIEEDEDFWREMEQDKNSNFILSDEELRIVQGNHEFPLFISGRAGSGKSTMLQYLFADYLLRYCQNDSIRPPVYLSYSSNLVDNAKRLSSSLFRTNHVYAEELRKMNKSFRDVEPLFNKVFFVFQDLVKDCISQKSPNIIQERFSQDCYVSYAKFRQLWEKKFGKTRNAEKEYGPALSWHVIRTYIKGWDSEAYSEPDDYEDIGKKNRSVTKEVFKKVFDKVWTEWYSPLQEEEHLWDDQDLVRYCLSPDDNSSDISCATERFSAVFCDESQDFTRIETEFILRISLFSHRKIAPYQRKQLPFVFVGDEFQTLNPTGFSWDSLRSYFTERLLSEGQGAPPPVTLTKNYRSTVPIVKLANRLQLLREVRFPSQSPSSPQIPYYADTEGASVYCLNPSNPAVWKKLSKMGIALIIPCAEGQSAQEYINNSPIKGMIDFYENGTAQNFTIFNPIQAKGLEYSNIAVYGFDDPDPDLKLKGLKKWLTSANPASDETKEIELKYFLSNAYVSATRAKSKLFILSDFNDQSFWAFAFSSQDTALSKEIQEVEQLMLKRVSENTNRNEWVSNDGEPLLGYIIQGDISEITSNIITDAGEIAKCTEERGMDLKDSSLMYQAAARYREQGKETDKLRCEAYASEFDQDYYEAADRFVAAEKYDEACENYWRACSQTKDIQPVLKKISELIYCSNIEVQAARLSNNKSVSAGEFKLLLGKLCEILDGPEDENDRNRKFALETYQTWSAVLQILLEKVPQVSPGQKNHVEAVLKLHASLKKHRILFGKTEIPKMAYDAGLFEEAISLWESCRLPEYPREYHKAKCEILRYPQNIVHLKLSGDPDWRTRIVEEYHDDRNAHEITDDASRKVLDMALFDVGSIEEKRDSLLRLLDNSGGPEEANALIDAADHQNISTAKYCFDALFRMRWGGLDQWDWSERTLSYESISLNQLIKTVCKIKEIRSSSFAGRFDKSLNKPGARVIDVMNTFFDPFRNVSWKPLLYTEIGALMEQRGNHLDAARFYEWAQKRSDDRIFIRDYVIRWIACKEKQADITKDEDVASELRQTAREERERWGISPNAVLPSVPKFEHWLWAFKEVLQQNAMLKRAVRKKRPAEEETKPVDVVPPNPTPAVPPSDTKPAGEPSVPEQHASAPQAAPEAQRGATAPVEPGTGTGASSPAPAAPPPVAPDELLKHGEFGFADHSSTIRRFTEQIPAMENESDHVITPKIRKKNQRIRFAFERSGSFSGELSGKETESSPAPVEDAADTDGSSVSVKDEPAPAAVAEPEPAVSEPASAAVVEPEPAVSETESAVSEPEPAVSEPAVSEPEPAMVEPEPAPAVSEPAVSEPEPAVVEPEPAPAVSEPEPAMVEPAPVAISEPGSGMSFDRFEISLSGYTVRYLRRPKRSEVTITYLSDDEDLRIKFKNGKNSGDDDFAILRDGRLVQNETKTETPFKIEIMKDAVRLYDTKTNVSFLFPF